MPRQLTPGMAESGLQQRRAQIALLHRLTGADSRAEATELAASWIEQPPDPLLTVDAHIVIEHCYAVGDGLADRIQTAAQVFAAVPLRDLTHSQRRALASALRLYGAGVATDRRRRRAA